MPHNAFLCHSCGFGSRATECVRCGGPFARRPARLCDACAFGAGGQTCVKCGGPFARIPALLCEGCGFGEKGHDCVACAAVQDGPDADSVPPGEDRGD